MTTAKHNTHHHAHHDKAHIEEVAGGIHSAQEQIEAVVNAAHKKYDELHEKYDQLQEQAEDVAQHLAKNVKAHPLASLGIALACGILIGKILK